MSQRVITAITSWLKRQAGDYTKITITVEYRNRKPETLVIDGEAASNNSEVSNSILRMKRFALANVIANTQRGNSRFCGKTELLHVNGLVPKLDHGYRLVTTSDDVVIILETPSKECDQLNSRRLKIDLGVYGARWLLEGEHTYGKAYDLTDLGYTKIIDPKEQVSELKAGVYLYAEPIKRSWSLLGSSTGPAGKLWVKGEVFFDCDALLTSDDYGTEAA